MERSPKPAATPALFAHYEPAAGIKPALVLLSDALGVLRRVVVADKVDARVIARVNRAQVCF